MSSRWQKSLLLDSINFVFEHGGIQDPNWADGRINDLGALIGRAPQREFSLDIIKCYMWQILRALKYLHASDIRVRNLTPESCILFPNNRLKLSDIGSARGIGEVSKATGYLTLTADSMVYEPPWYRAPEVVMAKTTSEALEYHKKPLDPRMDIFSAAVIWMEMLPSGDERTSLILRKHPYCVDKHDKGVSATLLRFFSIMGDPTSSSEPIPDSQFVPRIPTYHGIHANDPAMDLLGKMLAWNPKDRITAADALRHTFFAQEDPMTPLFNEMRRNDLAYDATAPPPVVFDHSWEGQYTLGRNRKYLDFVFPNQEALHVLEVLTDEIHAEVADLQKNPFGRVQKYFGTTPAPPVLRGGGVVYARKEQKARDAQTFAKAPGSLAESMISMVVDKREGEETTMGMVEFIDQSPKPLVRHRGVNGTVFQYDTASGPFCYKMASVHRHEGLKRIYDLYTGFRAFGWCPKLQAAFAPCALVEQQGTEALGNPFLVESCHACGCMSFERTLVTTEQTAPTHPCKCGHMAIDHVQTQKAAQVKLELLYESLTALRKSPNPIVDTSRIALRHWFKRMVDGLNALHELGYVHGNIKPANIMLDYHFDIKFVGFGHCKRVDECNFSEWMPADRDYAGPEYVYGLYSEKRSPIASDIWALGVCMLNYLAHDLPAFSMEDVVTEAILDAGISELLSSHANLKDTQLSDLLTKMLTVDPFQRVLNFKALQMGHPWLNEIQEEHRASALNTIVRWALDGPRQVSDTIFGELLESKTVTSKGFLRSAAGATALSRVAKGAEFLKTIKESLEFPKGYVTSKSLVDRSPVGPLPSAEGSSGAASSSSSSGYNPTDDMLTEGEFSSMNAVWGKYSSRHETILLATEILPDAVNRLNVALAVIPGLRREAAFESDRRMEVEFMSDVGEDVRAPVEMIVPKNTFQIGYQSLVCSVNVTPGTNHGTIAINLSLSEGTAFDLLNFVELLRAKLAIHVGFCCENPTCPNQGPGPERQFIVGNRYFCTECGHNFCEDCHVRHPREHIFLVLERPLAAEGERLLVPHHTLFSGMEHMLPAGSMTHEHVQCDNCQRGDPDRKPDPEPFVGNRYRLLAGELEAIQFDVCER